MMLFIITFGNLAFCKCVMSVSPKFVFCMPSSDASCFEETFLLACKLFQVACHLQPCGGMFIFEP